MAGQPENRENGNIGGSVVLDVIFSNFPGGSNVDDDRYSTDGTLPIVKIYDPDNNLITTSETSGEVQAVRSNTGSNDEGKYTYTRSIGLTDVISDKWKIVWTLQIDGTELNFSELFIVKNVGDAQFGEDEYRIGYSFDNPDLTSSHHHKDWGLLVTPDELRYVILFGTKLTSPDANQTFDDKMLQNYIDQAIAMVEADLSIDILPKIVRHVDPVDNTGSTFSAGGSLRGEGNIIRTEEPRLARVDIPDGEINIREEGYPYRPQNAKHYMFLKLRRRPLIDLLKAVIVDPVQNTVLDIYPWRRVFAGFDSRLNFVANIKGGTYPLSSSSFLRYSYGDFPTSIYVDYRTGFLRASDVPMEFRDVIMWIAGIQLLESFGDGKSPGLASASVNLNSISESFATTQSATNALFGARITYYKDHLKEWYKKNRYKYQRTILGVL